ncbi:hypothetical protein UT300003_29350 [Clostridium sardiniense]
MILPNKLLAKEKSLMYKGLKLLENHQNNIEIMDFYERNISLFDGIYDYIRVITVLYILGYIEVSKGEVIKNDL